MYIYIYICMLWVISWLNDCEDMKLVVPTNVVLFH